MNFRKWMDYKWTRLWFHNVSLWFKINSNLVLQPISLNFYFSNLNLCHSHPFLTLSGDILGLENPPHNALCGRCIFLFQGPLIYGNCSLSVPTALVGRVSVLSSLLIMQAVADRDGMCFYPVTAAVCSAVPTFRSSWDLEPLKMYLFSVTINKTNFVGRNISIF